MNKGEIVKVLKTSIRMIKEELDSDDQRYIAEFIEDQGVEPIESVVKTIMDKGMTYHQALFYVDDYCAMYRRTLDKMARKISRSAWPKKPA